MGLLACIMGRCKYSQYFRVKSERNSFIYWLQWNSKLILLDKPNLSVWYTWTWGQRIYIWSACNFTQSVSRWLKLSNFHSKCHFRSFPSRHLFSDCIYSLWQSYCWADFLINPNESLLGLKYSQYRGCFLNRLECCLHGYLMLRRYQFFYYFPYLMWVLDQV